MADITVTTDVSQINNLKDALKSLDPVFVKIVDGIVRENSRLQRLLKKAAKDTEENNKILAQAQEAYSAKLEQESAKREKARAREAAQAEKEAKRIADANQKIIDSEVKRRAKEEQAAANYAQNFQGQVGGNLGLGARGISAGASAGAFEAEVERLRQKYDQIYASSQLYERSLQELNKAHALGVMSAKQHEAAVESLNAEYQAFQSGVAQAGNRFAQHVNQTSDGMNKFGVAAQQTGYQVSDFIVQVQSGTNPLVAFSQQATQLAGLLYLLPASMQAARIGIGAFSVSMATATAGLTILIPLLAMIAMNFIGSGKESEEASKKVDKQTKAYEGLIAKIEELRLKRQMEASGIQGQDEQITINEINRLKEEQIALQKEINALSLAASPAGKIEAKDLADKKKALQATLDDRQATLDKLALELQIDDVLKRKAQAVANANKEELSDRQSLIQAHAAQVQLMGQSQNSQRLMALSVQEALDKYAKMRSVVQDASDIAKRITLLGAKKDAEGFNKAIEDALAAGIQFSLVDLSSIVALAARNGWDLAAALTAAYNVAASRNPAAASVLTGAGGRPNINPNDMQYRGPVQNAQVDIMQYQRQLDEDAANAGGGGGAGGGSIDSLINQLQTEREILEEWYIEGQESLTAASESELAIIGGYNEAKLRLAQEYQDRLRGILSEEKNYRLNEMGSMFGALADVAGAGGKKMLKVQATISAAATTIAAYETAVKAAAEAKTLPGRIAAYAKFLATGLKAVSAIRSAGGIGGGGGSSGGVGGGSPGSATVAQSAAPATPQTVLISGLDPNALFTGEQLSRLFENFYKENDNRGKVFVVAR